MALTERHTHHEAEEATIRLSVVRASALCLVAAFTFFLAWHIEWFGWDAAGCGVFIACLAVSWIVAVRPCLVPRLLNRRGE
jgi:hypothetical protein